MTENNKRFRLATPSHEGHKEYFICDDLEKKAYDLFLDCSIEDFLDKVNELHEEKERWKSMCMSSSSENSLLWNEISILREQGAEPSDAFKEYLERISTEHTKFWQRKLEKAKKDGVIE